MPGHIGTYWTQELDDAGAWVWECTNCGHQTPIRSRKVTKGSVLQVRAIERLEIREGHKHQVLGTNWTTNKTVLPGHLTFIIPGPGNAGSKQKKKCEQQGSGC